MPMYNLIEFIDDYSKPAGILWEYYRDGSYLDSNDAIDNFLAANISSKNTW